MNITAFVPVMIWFNTALFVIAAIYAMRQLLGLERGGYLGNGHGPYVKLLQGIAAVATMKVFYAVADISTSSYGDFWVLLQQIIEMQIALLMIQASRLRRLFF